MLRKERAIPGIHSAVSALLQSLEIPKAAQVLDVGCGAGALLSKLKKHGFDNLAGVDICPPCSADSEDLLGVSFVSADLDAPISDAFTRKFDVVLAVELIEHLENLGLWLGEIRKLLSDDGFFIVTTPNLHSLEARIRYLACNRLYQFDAYGDPTHIAPLFLDPACKLFSRYGLKVQTVSGFPSNGSSLQSSPALKAIAGFLRLVGLPEKVAGDTLILVLRPAGSSISAASKKRLVTAHYT